MLLVLALIWCIFAFTTDGAFLQPRNLSNLFRQMSITGVLASGMVFVIVAGHIDLSVGSVLCFVGAAMAIINADFGVSPTTSFFLALAIGLVIGGLQGLLISFQKIPAFIVTLGGMMAFRGASLGITQGNTIPLSESWVQSLATSYLPIPVGWALAAIICGAVIVSAKRFSGHSREKIFSAFLLILGTIVFTAVMSFYEGIPLPVLVTLVLAVFFQFVAKHTLFGRYVYAIGGNVEAAELSGINVKKITFGIFLLMGLLSAVAGVLFTGRVGSASPDAGQLLELDAIAACVMGGTSLLGGRGTIFGAVLGALFMESLNNGMSLMNMESFWQYIVKGLVLVIAVWADLRSAKN